MRTVARGFFAVLTIVPLLVTPALADGVAGVTGGWVGMFANGVDALHVTATGNVGIGTTSPGTSGLAVMNGSLGIGTVAPANALDVATASGGIHIASGV